MVEGAPAVQWHSKRLPKVLLFGIFFLGLYYPLISRAQNSCDRDAATACFQLEKLKPDASRGGISAAEYCAASAVIHCAAGQGTEMPSNRDTYAGSTSRRDSTSAENNAKPLDMKDVTVLDFGGAPMFIKNPDPLNAAGFIKWKGKTLFETDQFYMSLKYFFRIHEGGDVVIYATNPGGSGTPSSYSLIAASSTSITPYQAKLPWGNREIPEIRLEGETLFFDFGFSDGKAIKAVFKNGVLTQAPDGPVPNRLSDQDCYGLYDTVIESCSKEVNKFCRYKDIRSSWAMVHQRFLVSVETDPAFRANGFEKACEAKCETGKRPFLGTFKETVCGW